jgi:2-polyprenyl-3-methyl-5-hydroxy-6-metoxy-1,4-benzoquinol methylase
MVSIQKALARLDDFGKEVPQYYSRPREDYRGREINVESVTQYLKSERERFAEVASMIPDPQTSDEVRLLDVGIAYGFLPALLKAETKWQCEGLEVAENVPVYCSFAQARGIPIHPGKLGLESLPFKNESFNAILFSEVLEHLRLSPSLVFHEFNRLLSKRGYLLVTTPNFARLTNIVKLFIGENPLESFPDRVPTENITDHLTHIREYTMRELKGLCKRNGFRIIETRFSSCMERGRSHSLLTTLIPPWRGSLMVLAQKI